ncbi:MAG: TonB-dependent receptor [Lysobacterales bacterium]
MIEKTRRYGLLALLLSVALAAPTVHAQTLEQALRRISEAQGWNYLLGPGVNLSLSVDDDITTEGALIQWLPSAGITLHILPSGDRELRKLSLAKVSLDALPITAQTLSGSGPPLRAGVSATVFSAEDIANLNDTQLDQLFARAANVFGSGDEYYVRGVASGGDLNTLGNAAALVGKAPLAGVVLGNLPLSTWDTSRAGFERGNRSASVAGPFSSFAGRISIEPTAPGFQSEQRINVGVTELLDTQVSLLTNPVLIEDELALRVSVDRQTLAGTLTDPGTLRNEGLGKNYDGRRSTTGRAALLWEPADWPSLRFTLDLMAINGSSGPQRIATTDPFSRVGRSPPFRRRNVDGQLATLTGMMQRKPVGQISLDLVASRGTAELLPSRVLSNDLDPTDPLVDEEHDDLKFAHLNWQKTWGNTTVGVGLSSGQNLHNDGYLREQRSWTLRSRLSRKTAAISLDTALTSHWKLQAGLRYTRDHLQRSCRSSLLLSPTGADSDCLQVLGLLLIPQDGQFEAFSQRYSNASPELALAYKPSDLDEYFVRLAEGFNAGGAISDATFSGTPQWIFYDPERSRSAELGWRGKHGRLNIDATVFHTELDRQWQVVQGNVGLGDVINAGNSRSRGVELDGRWKLDSAHQLAFSLGWLDTRFNNFLPFETDAQLESAAGNQFPGAPEFSGSLSWRAQLGPRWQIGAGLSFHGAVQANANNPDSARIPGVVLADLRIAWQRSALTLALTARNLFDRNYQQTTPNVIRRNQRIDYLPGRPRNVGVTVQYVF